jgi:hypothetical protein
MNEKIWGRCFEILFALHELALAILIDFKHQSLIRLQTVEITCLFINFFLAQV